MMHALTSQTASPTKKVVVSKPQTETPRVVFDLVSALRLRLLEDKGLSWSSDGYELPFAPPAVASPFAARALPVVEPLAAFLARLPATASWRATTRRSPPRSASTSSSASGSAPWTRAAIP